MKKHYVKYIINFIRSNSVQSVLDLGCGDWQSSYLFYSHIYLIYRLYRYRLCIKCN